MGVDESLSKYREGKSTSQPCFTTPTEMKGVTSLSARVRGAGLQLALECLSKACCRLAFKNEGSAMTREAAMSRQFIL